MWDLHVGDDDMEVWVNKHLCANLLSVHIHIHIYIYIYMYTHINLISASIPLYIYTHIIDT